MRKRKQQYRYRIPFSLIVTCLFFCLFIINTQHLKAQLTDTTKVTSQQIKAVKKDSLYHSPRKAAIYSTFLPGLGQAYNKKYWKIPLVYAAIGGLTYSVIYNQKNYILYRSAYRYRLDTTYSKPEELFEELNADYLLKYTKYFHRWRDLSIFGTALVYLLNIVDATVDAHLFTFDVSDDLSLRIRPVVITTAGINPVNNIGVSVNFNFKR